METARIRVRGQVQGVGFRPFIWQLARRFGIRGEVLNDPEGVLIHATGADLTGFVAAISAEASAATGASTTSGGSAASTGGGDVSGASATTGASAMASRMPC